MTVIGEISLLAKIDTSAYKKGEQDIKKANADMENSGNKTSSGLSSGFSKVAKVGMAGLAAATVAVSALIVKNFGNAIKRIDTLNNSSRTFENMGFATKTVSSSMKALEKSITGLPTPLDSAVRGMTSLSATYGDVQLGQKVFTSLNNAILGFGGSAAEVDNAIQQLSQLPMDGPLDAQTWNSLRNSGLTPVLVAMSKDMGISINEMKEKFGEGELTVKDFTDSLIKMNKDGGGGMKSLEKIAKDSTSGIGTGWANMQTAITKGIATIVESIGSSNITNAIGLIGTSIRGLLEMVALAIPKLIELGSQVGEYLTPKFSELWTSITTQLIPALTRFWQDVVQPILPVLGTALVAAIGAVLVALNLLIPVITSVTNFLSDNKEMIELVVVSLIAFKTTLLIGQAAAAFNASLAAMRAALSLYGIKGIAVAIVQTKALKLLVSTPMIMPAIAIAAALVAIYKIQKELKITLALIKRADDSANGLQDQRSEVLRRMQSTDDPKKKAQLKKILNSTAPGRASGGFVAGGSPYTVGERGRELFVPQTDGFIIPNNATEDMFKASNTPSNTTVINVTANLDGIIARSRSDLRDVGTDIIRAVNEGLQAKQQPVIGGGNI